MRQLLVYGDSLSWGIVPLTRQRLPFEQRWPGVLEAGLNAAGAGPIRVLEDCLNGRRTVFEDPYKPGRNGLEGLQQRIEAQSPLDGVLLMLGTNDWQSMHLHSAAHAAQGVAAVVSAIRAAPIEPGMPVPPVLILIPPRPIAARGPLAWKFEGADHKAEGLVAAYEAVAAELSCPCFDAGSVIGVSAKDGVHLDAEAHERLGVALVGQVLPWVAAPSPPTVPPRRPVVWPPGEGRRYAMGGMDAVFKADGAETGSRYSISEWWLAPHTQGPGAHAHPEDDMFYVLEGTMSLRVGEAWVEAECGAFVLVPAGVTHDFENRSDQRAGVLNLSFPGGFEPHMAEIVQWFKEHPLGAA